MKIGACYIRVSTAEQTEYSPESQLRMIRDYAAKNGIVIPEEHIYRDEGISGRNAEKRPAFQKMLTAAKQKSFEVILIYSTSRFARNHEQSIVYRSMLERECGVELLSITQPNVDKKTDMLTNAIYSIIDEWYSLDLSDNVKRGMTEKAMRGGYQTAPPLGYEQKHKGELMTIKEDEAKIIRYIFQEFLRNKSKWKIARELMDMGAKTKRGACISTRNIIYILRNPVYKGYTRWTPTARAHWDFKNNGTITTKGQHEPIVDEKIFDEAQLKLDAHEASTSANARPQESTKHWLSGLLKCSECGQTLCYNGVTPKRKSPSFRCGGYNRGTCKTMNFILESEAEMAVKHYLTSIAKDIDLLYNANIERIGDNTEQIHYLKAEIKKLRSKLEKAKLGFLNDLFPMEEYRSIKNNCENEIEAIEKKIEHLSESAIDYDSFQKDIINACETLSNDKFDKNEKQAAVRSIFKKIVFNKKSREFRFYFYR